MGLRGSSSQTGAALHISAKHHLSTFIGKYMLLLMDTMMIAYAIDAILLSWGILTRTPGYWGLYEIQVTPDTRKTKEMTSGKLDIPAVKERARTSSLNWVAKALWHASVSWYPELCHVSWLWGWRPFRVKRAQQEQQAEGWWYENKLLREQVRSNGDQAP